MDDAPDAPPDLAEIKEEVSDLLNDPANASGLREEVHAMADFTAFSHPVLAVACPDCRKREGVMCYRPSGHRASDFHRARRLEADRVFIAQHGVAASIERTKDGWRIDPAGFNPDPAPESSPSHQLEFGF